MIDSESFEDREELGWVLAGPPCYPYGSCSLKRVLLMANSVAFGQVGSTEVRLVGSLGDHGAGSDDQSHSYQC